MITSPSPRHTFTHQHLARPLTRPERNMGFAAFVNNTLTALVHACVAGTKAVTFHSEVLCSTALPVLTFLLKT